jgi:ribosomal protein L34E
MKHHLWVNARRLEVNERADRRPVGGNRCGIVIRKYYREELAANWRRIEAGEPLEGIEPLD